MAAALAEGAAELSARRSEADDVRREGARASLAAASLRSQLAEVGSRLIW